jgi:hypothetical protein
MTDKRLERILSVNFSFIAFLIASFEGKYVFFNSLKHLDSKVDVSSLNGISSVINKLTVWIKKTYASLVVFPQEGDVFDAEKEADAYIIDTERFIAEICKSLDRFSANPENIYDSQNLKLVISAYAAYAYMRKHLTQLFQGYYIHSKKQEQADYWQVRFNQSLYLVEKADYYFSVLRQSKADSRDFKLNLYQDFITLSSRLKVHLHEMKMRKGKLADFFSYAEIGISKEEATLWANANIAPDKAGYWKAFGFHPQEVMVWNELGFKNPALAGAWKLRKYSLDLAYDWHKAGYTPRQADVFLSQGIEHPNNVPD